MHRQGSDGPAPMSGPGALGGPPGLREHAGTYDYVVVGAGSAGCVLASRLSENPDTAVLLLEAGGHDRKPAVCVPAAFSTLFRTDADWDDLTEPQPALDGRELYWPRGKILGGSSSINAMVYIRGNRLDYDSWAAAGHSGWDYASVLPYFLKSENNSRGPSPYHAVGGPLDVCDQRFRHPLSYAFGEAAVAAGLAENADFNGATQDGVGFYQVTQRRGRRVSASSAFLRPAARRPNLTVHTATTVRRVVWERGRVVGVEIEADGGLTVVRADREVLVAAGTVGSAALLLRSGIGPADDLTELGIPVRHDAPGVGRGLRDQPTIGVGWFVDGLATLESARRPANLARYALGRRGPLASNVAETGGFVSVGGGAAPDLQLHVSPALFVDHGLSPPPGPGVTLGLALLTPESRGRVTLRSGDPEAKPRIQPNYCAEGGDLARLVDGLELVLEIGAKRPLARFCRSRFELDGTDRASLERWTRARTQTLYHPTSSCAMGEVVDTELKVYGVEGLRVCDASVLPASPRGNTNAPVIMVAERAAELVGGQAGAGSTV